jgi:hypothetical protein
VKPPALGKVGRLFKVEQSAVKRSDFASFNGPEGFLQRDGINPYPSHDPQADE